MCWIPHFIQNFDSVWNECCPVPRTKQHLICPASMKINFCSWGLVVWNGEHSKEEQFLLIGFGGLEWGIQQGRTISVHWIWWSEMGNTTRKNDICSWDLVVWNGEYNNKEQFLFMGFSVWNGEYNWFKLSRFLPWMFTVYIRWKTMRWCFIVMTHDEVVVSFSSHAWEDLGRMFNNLFPTCAFLPSFFSKWRLALAH